MSKYQMQLQNMLTVFAEIQRRIQTYQQTINDMAHGTFAAGSYVKLPDSFDFCEMAHLVRNSAFQAAVLLGELSSAIETMQVYAEERKALLDGRERHDARED